MEKVATKAVSDKDAAEKELAEINIPIDDLREQWEQQRAAQLSVKHRA